MRRLRRLCVMCDVYICVVCERELVLMYGSFGAGAGGSLHT